MIVQKYFFAIGVLSWLSAEHFWKFTQPCSKKAILELRKIVFLSFKNLVGNFFHNGSRYLKAKMQASSFKTEQAFWGDRQT